MLGENDRTSRSDRIHAVGPRFNDMKKKSAGERCRMRFLGWWRRWESNPGPERFGRGLYVRSRCLVPVSDDWSGLTVPAPAWSIGPCHPIATFLVQGNRDTPRTSPKLYVSRAPSDTRVVDVPVCTGKTCTKPQVVAPLFTWPEAPRYATRSSLSLSKPVVPLHAAILSSRGGGP